MEPWRLTRIDGDAYRYISIERASTVFITRGNASGWHWIFDGSISPIGYATAHEAAAAFERWQNDAQEQAIKEAHRVEGSQQGSVHRQAWR